MSGIARFHRELGCFSMIMLEQTTQPLLPLDLPYRHGFSRWRYGVRGSFRGRRWRARWYAPTTGRFISEDPLGWPGDDQGNLYRYVSNGPMMYVDPSGLLLDGILGGIGSMIDSVFNTISEGLSTAFNRISPQVQNFYVNSGNFSTQVGSGLGFGSDLNIAGLSGNANSYDFSSLLNTNMLSMDYGALSGLPGMDLYSTGYTSRNTSYPLPSPVSTFWDTAYIRLHLLKEGIDDSVAGLIGSGLYYTGIISRDTYERESRNLSSVALGNNAGIIYHNARIETGQSWSSSMYQSSGYIFASITGFNGYIESKSDQSTVTMEYLNQDAYDRWGNMFSSVGQIGLTTAMLGQPVTAVANRVVPSTRLTVPMEKVNSGTNAVLRNGYYEVNGFKFSEYYYNKLWSTGRGAPALVAREVLDGAGGIGTLNSTKSGFFTYNYGGWEMVYNPITKEVWHLQPIK